VDTIDDLHDDGLFGPDSVTWRVHLEPVLWIAGMRALLLQSLHPRVMRGTYQNSALFDPKKAWPRFQRTVEFVGTRTFGSTSEIEAAGGRVRRLHAALRGFDPDTGNDFRLDLPDNLLWVHACEIDSYVDVARRAGVIDDAGADAYLAESVRAAQVVGLDPAIVPSSRRAMVAYFDRVRPGLRLCDEARLGVGGLLTPQPHAPASAAIALSTIAGLAFGTLPRWARRLYGLPGLPTTDAATTVALRLVRGATSLLPDPPMPPRIARARDLVRSA
jgi:uncharacterized protein (DUF2236 family)